MGKILDVIDFLSRIASGEITLQDVYILLISAVLIGFYAFWLKDYLENNVTRESLLAFDISKSMSAQIILLLLVILILYLASRLAA
ncbi:MAG: hypothetical protein CVV42_19085 [Candidatus Riflebacteria bacterium HGW-Riflebacteria-2]|jgi:hypothetical protein|nr:MAG: hypothetical protein CVV42_19085 [Candidatus Riflebacteria bacterium HGW-Riflebacteria-2]